MNLKIKIHRSVPEMQKEGDTRKRKLHEAHSMPEEVRQWYGSPVSSWAAKHQTQLANRPTLY